MKSIVDQLQETVKLEELKNLDNASFEETKQLIDAMSKLGLVKKSGYTLPLVDTIGRGFSLNKRLPT